MFRADPEVGVRDCAHRFSTVSFVGGRLGLCFLFLRFFSDEQAVI